MFKLFDSHAHVQFAAFEKDYKEVIGRALENGIGMVNVGTQKDTSRRAVEIANEYPKGVYAAVGLHPTHTEKSFHDEQELGGGEGVRAFTSRGEEFDYAFYKKLAEDKKVAAIGECGLDYYRLEVGSGKLEEKTKNLQKEVFLKHIQLAEEVKKPLMIHCRPSKGANDAYEDLLILLTLQPSTLNPIVHFYIGGIAITKKLLEAGCYFTFGGVITFARNYDEVVQYIPLDRILLETDAPYVAPAPYRGQRNEPSYVLEVAKKVAELKSESLEKICKITTENCRQMFKL